MTFKCICVYNSYIKCVFFILKDFKVEIWEFRGELLDLIRKRGPSVNSAFGTELKSRIKDLEDPIKQAKSIIWAESKDIANVPESYEWSINQYELQQHLNNIVDRLLKIIEVCNEKGRDIGDLTFVLSKYAVWASGSLKVSIDEFTSYINNKEIKIDSIGGINEVINLIVSFYNAICDSINRAKGELMTRMFGSEIAINESTREIKRSTGIDNMESIACDLYVSIINFLIWVLDQSFEEDCINFCDYKIKSDYLRNKFLSLKEKWPKTTESEDLDLDQIEPKKIEVGWLDIIKCHIRQILAKIMGNK